MGKSSKKSPGLKKPYRDVTFAAVVMLLHQGMILFWGKTKKHGCFFPAGHPRDQLQIPSGGWCHGPGWVPGLGCAISPALSPAPTSKSIIVPDHVYWLHSRKILNKANKPCATNPRVVSPARVSNGFSMLLPALDPSSVTPRPSPLFQGWDGEAGIASPPGSAAGKAPSVYLQQLFCSCPACQSKHAGAGLP